VRKRFPKDYKGWVYIYCTKEDSLIKLQERYKDRYTCEQEFRCDDFPKMYSGYEGKGKVVARFYCDKVEEIYIRYGEGWVCGNLIRNEIEKETCLSRYELYDYLKGNTGYAIHISQLEIFDKPKELSEFRHYNKPSCDNCPFQYSADCDYHREVECDDIPLTKAPQNICYVEVE
jgi:predicted transcriptional regulator